MEVYSSQAGDKPNSMPARFDTKQKGVPLSELRSNPQHSPHVPDPQHSPHVPVVNHHEVKPIIKQLKNSDSLKPKASKPNSAPAKIKIPPETHADRIRQLFAQLDTPLIKNQLKTAFKHFKTFKKQIYDTKKIRQWVLATPLDVEKDLHGRLKLKYNVDPKTNLYKNYVKDKATNCSPRCLNKICELPTRTRINALLKKKLDVHTEIQMLYRDDETIDSKTNKKVSNNLMKNPANKGKVILVYSTYIPCSQNQKPTYGDSIYVECAGEMANFVARNNKNNNRFIVMYEKEHKVKKTVVPVSELYLEMAGIPCYRYDEGSDRLDLAGSRLHFSKHHFFKNPIAIQFSRPRVTGKDNDKYSAAQLFIDCLARNSFLFPERASDRKKAAVEFDVVKYYLYKTFYNRELGNGDLPDVLYNKIKPKVEGNTRRKVIAKACKEFADAIRLDGVKKETCQKFPKNHYILFNGDKSDAGWKIPQYKSPNNQTTCRESVNKVIEVFGDDSPALKIQNCQPPPRVSNSRNRGYKSRRGGPPRNGIPYASHNGYRNQGGPIRSPPQTEPQWHRSSQNGRQNRQQPAGKSKKWKKKVKQTPLSSGKKI